MEFSLGLMKDQAEIISELKGIFRNCEIKAPGCFEEMLTLQNIPEERILTVQPVTLKQHL